MTGPTPDEDDLVAAEWVLGVHEGEERAALAQRLKTDDAFAARVAAWQARLSPLDDSYDEAPAPDLLPQIEARLFPKAAPARSGLRGWFLGALSAAVAVAALVVVILVQGPAAPGLVARMDSPDATLSYEARFVGDRLTVTRVAGEPAPEGQVHELWIIAPGAAPVSLGLLAEAPLALDYPVPPKGWVLAVSLEPEGGSPGDAPTGPVLVMTEIGT